MPAEHSQRSDHARPHATMDGGAVLTLVEADDADTGSLIRLDAAVRGKLTATAENIKLLLAHARVSFLVDQRNPKATRARDSARRLIELAPELAEGYRLLGLAHLSRGEYREAFIALTACKAIGDDDGFEPVRRLARKLMSNVTPLGFDLAGDRYTFDLTAHNAAALEASALHSIGTLRQWETLDYLSARLKAPRRIVEVGALLGDHTAFFLKRFRPARLTVIEADPDNIRFVRRTAAMNLPPTPLSEVVIHHAYVSADSRDSVAFAGTVVPQQPLPALAPDQVDLLKISAAGDPIAVLAGALPVIEQARPAVMIRVGALAQDRVGEWFANHGYRIDRVIAERSRRDLIAMPE
jgi:hypothetical protein